MHGKIVFCMIPLIFLISVVAFPAWSSFNPSPRPPGPTVNVWVYNYTNYSMVFDLDPYSGIIVVPPYSKSSITLDCPFKVFYTDRRGYTHYFVLRGSKIIRLYSNAVIKFVKRYREGRGYVVMRIQYW